MTANAETLVRALARLDPALRRDTVRAAKARRQRDIRTAVCKARSELLAEYSDRQAAHIIDDIVQGRRVGALSPGLRADITGLLVGEIGTTASFHPNRSHRFPLG